MSSKKLITIVIPAYNEEGNLFEVYRQIKRSLEPLLDEIEYEIIFVNDGSNDDTLAVMKSIMAIGNAIRVVNFDRNFGHEIAMTAGLDYAKGEAVIFMDADLQHPPQLLPKMIKKWREGYEIVLTKIIKNEDKGFVKNILSSIFYKFSNMISDVKIPPQTPDFRLVSGRYIKTLRDMRESSRMFRGMLNWLGLSNVAEIEFVAPKRYSGKTNYNLIKSLKLAFDSILQFSIKPLRLSIYLGIISAVITMIFALWTIYEHYHLHQPSGYATITCLVIFLSSIQFIILGIMGEYIGRIHIESKSRPLYFAELLEKKPGDENAKG
jgi:glycosyltransferase involved in cell wall biosynthesis